MKTLLCFCLLLLNGAIFGQPWIDLSYEITTEKDIVYGTATGFAGATDSLKFDLSLPTNDSAPECGRPLAVIIHGGGWLGGDKDAGNARRLREDFAARGYAAASVNYRLGMFHTDLSINCNVDGWNCLNMADSSEYYRANYRAMQDVNGAIRFLVNQAEDYQINPDNLFLIGESAGGFVALGVGFIDHPSEIMAELTGEYEDVPAPNPNLEGECIQGLGLANSISAMNLSRPDLGDLAGELNLPLLNDYRIRAVGNIYGGAFNNIFESHSDHSPALYMFHQPCDLIVPFGHNRAYGGYAQCAVNLAGCSYLINRPLVYGSLGIKQLIDAMNTDMIPTAAYQFDQSNSNASCLEQLIFNNQQCHALDNYSLRTNSMATYFAGFVADCGPTATTSPTDQASLRLYPNPADNILYLQLASPSASSSIIILNAIGQPMQQINAAGNNQLEIDLNLWPPGLYFVLERNENSQQVIPFLKR